MGEARSRHAQDAVDNMTEGEKVELVLLAKDLLSQVKANATRGSGRKPQRSYPPVPKDPTWEAFTQEYMGEE